MYSPNTPSWRGAQLKHRDHFTLFYLYKKGRVSNAMRETSDPDTGRFSKDVRW